LTSGDEGAGRRDDLAEPLVIGFAGLRGGEVGDFEPASGSSPSPGARRANIASCR
jgi:hypothetical protein